MMLENELNKFKEINAVAAKGGIVFTGGKCFASLPLAELAKSFHVDENLYNRSVEGMTLASVTEHLNELVLDLKPCKIFFNLGEAEAENELPAEEFLSAFEWLLCSVHNKSDAEIYVVSLAPKTKLCESYNKSLKKLCSESGYKFIDISAALAGESPEIKIFRAIKLYLHRGLDFADLMLMH